MATIQSRSRKGRALRPSKLTKQDDDRRLLAGGYVERRAGVPYLFVTDSIMVARFKLHDAAQVVDGFVPREALLHIEREPLVEFDADADEIRIGETHSIRTDEGYKKGPPRARYSRAEPRMEYEDRRYPNLAEAFPAQSEQRVSIGIDTVALRRLAMAVGQDTLHIEVDVGSERIAPPLLVSAPNDIAAVIEQSRVGKLA